MRANYTLLSKGYFYLNLCRKKMAKIDWVTRMRWISREALHAERSSVRLKYSMNSITHGKQNKNRSSERQTYGDETRLAGEKVGKLSERMNDIQDWLVTLLCYFTRTSHHRFDATQKKMVAIKAHQLSTYCVIAWMEEYYLDRHTKLPP